MRTPLSKSVCLSVYLSVCLSIYPLVCLSVCLFWLFDTKLISKIGDSWVRDFSSLPSNARPLIGVMVGGCTMVQNNQESRGKYWATISSARSLWATSVEQVDTHSLAWSAQLAMRATLSHLLASHCSQCSRALLRSFPCSLICFRSHGKEVFIHDMKASIFHSFNPFWDGWRVEE